MRVSEIRVNQIRVNQGLGVNNSGPFLVLRKESPKKNDALIGPPQCGLSS